MKPRQRLRQNVDLIKKELLVLYFAYQDLSTGWLPKSLILLTLGYALSPVDLIPDFIPVIGYLDDLVIIPVLILLTIKLIPDDVMRNARSKAEKTEIKLRKRWFFGFVFIMLWIIGLLNLINHYLNSLNN